MNQLFQCNQCKEIHTKKSKNLCKIYYNEDDKPTYLCKQCIEIYEEEFVKSILFPKPTITTTTQ